MWSKCTGSMVGLNEARKVATDNVASVEGTTAHTLLEICLSLWVTPWGINFSHILAMLDLDKNFLSDQHRWAKGVIDNINNNDDVVKFARVCISQIESGEFTDEMRIEITKCYDRIKVYKDDGWVVLAERKVSLYSYFGHHHSDGSADVTMYKGDRLIIADLKYGKGIEVSPVKNGQVSLYAGGALDYIYKLTGLVMENIESVIMQPRINNGVWKVWSFKYSGVGGLAEFLQFAKVKSDAAIAALQGGVAEFNPSDSSCTWCHRKSNCKARLKMGNDKVREAFLAAGVVEGSQLDIHGIDNNAIADILDRSPFVISLFKDIGEEAEKRAQKGQVIPRRKLVKGRSSRKWRENEDLVAQFDAVHISPEVYLVTKMRSPAQMDGVQLTDHQKDRVQSMINKSFGREALVSESDPRPAVVKNVRLAFEKALSENK